MGALLTNVNSSHQVPLECALLARKGSSVATYYIAGAKLIIAFENTQALGENTQALYMELPQPLKTKLSNFGRHAPIEVRVLPDRIEIVSHPGADRSVSLAGLKSYRVFCRRYRNRRGGEILKELYFAEGRNTGFRKILNAMSKNGSPKPLFETDDARTYFATTFYIYPAFGEENSQDRTQDEIKNKILDFCRIPRGKSEILEMLGYKSPKRLTMRYLRPLLDNGTLVMTLPDKPSSKHQKYLSMKPNE